ncbi:MAG: SlyX family protein [bacterium]|jgi:uncharacterized coiled-coil protein SlyX
MEKRLIDLEVKILFLEETLDTLNEVILSQGRNIETLEQKLERLESASLAPGEEASKQDERPPHY